MIRYRDEVTILTSRAVGVVMSHTPTRNGWSIDTGGRRRHAKGITLRRTGELMQVYAAVSSHDKRQAGGYPDLAATALDHAELWLRRATERGEDDAERLSDARALVASRRTLF